MAPKNVDQLEMIPPYCTNLRCVHHFGSISRFYVKNGFVATDKPPFSNQRFKCKTCHTQFSVNSFGLDFRKKISGINERILHYSMNGMSNNSIAKLLSIAEGTVRDRLKEMSRQSLYFEKEHLPKVITEDIAYDGFETFTFSQFSPCYINTAVGSHSHYIYHNTFSPLNRKGRMTQRQNRRNCELIHHYGHYPRNSVYEESQYILKELSMKARGRTLYTDQHRSYLKAYHSFDCKMSLKTINSRQRRDANNPLFPINRLHNLYRHFISSQHRETISFQKHEAALLEKIQLMKIYRNFMNPKFVKKNKYDPNASTWSPAMYVGVVSKVLSFYEVFGLRRRKTQLLLDKREKDFIDRRYPYSRQKITG